MKLAFFVFRLPFAVIGLAIVTVFLPIWLLLGILGLIFRLSLLPVAWTFTLIPKFMSAAFKNDSNILKFYIKDSSDHWDYENRKLVEEIADSFYKPYRYLGNWLLYGSQAKS